MTKNSFYDAIIIGSGPNGLAAGIKLAQEGLSVAIFEAKDTVGGGMRSAELTLPGFTHDICSAIHPLGVGSPFFKSLPLEKFGLKWIFPEASLAHPLDNGSVVLLEKSIDATCSYLNSDASAYKKLMEPLVKNWNLIDKDLLAPLRIPHHPILMAQFALNAVRPATNLAKSLFKEDNTRAFFAGLAAHSILPLNKSLTSAFGLILGTLGHAIGWPLPRGGSQSIANALADYFQFLNGKIFTNHPVNSLEELPAASFYIFDTSPKEMIRIVKNHFPESYINKLETYRYGPGVFKMDWALSQPIPWKDKACARAATVHLGGSFDEIVASENSVWKNQCSDKPFIILAQPSLFDPSRAPKGKATAWGYCHVPNNSTIDMREKIEAQIERFAPGFKECILARTTKNAQQLEQYNPNYVGGDINCGVQDLFQLFTRPTARFVPYSTPNKKIYICSSATPPGGGVHGMCGFHAANAILQK